MEVEFKAPLDYKEIPLQKKQSHFAIENEEEKQREEAKRKVEQELSGKFKRLDGKQLTQKQKEDLIKQELEKIQVARKDEDFDPRKHRLKHGIRNYGNLDKTTNFQAMKGGVKLN